MGLSGPVGRLVNLTYAMEPHDGMEKAIQAVNREIFWFLPSGKNTFFVPSVYPLILLVQPKL